MNDHPWRFIDDNDGRVFIENGEWKGLRFQGKGFGFGNGP
jgi:hypothetical protein